MKTQTKSHAKAKQSLPSDSHVPDARRRRVLALLADGNFASGETLAHEMRITRSAVWKLIGKLRALNIEIEAVSRQGYRLPQPVELYDSKKIQAAVSPGNADTLQAVHALLTIDSTNRFLSDAPVLPPGQASVCVAEVQTAGRGRRGRSWLAPFASGVCLSVAWQFAEAPPTLSALSLAVGVAVVRALRGFGCDTVQLKWPNDLVYQNRKLAGILIDVCGEVSGPVRIVIGLGLNLRLPAATRLALAEQQATLVADLQELLRERTPGRNELVGSVVDELINVLRLFEREGFTAFESEWRSYDSLNGAAVRVLSANETINGIARGVAHDGALLVEVNGAVQRFMSGDVSLRSAK